MHYIIQNTNHQQMHKESYIVNRNTLLHVSTLLGRLQGELSVTVTLRLHFIVEWECDILTQL
jgi:exonuclease I